MKNQLTIRLTDRDRAIIFDCHQNGVLSFNQIKERYFKNQNKVTVSNRLRCLRNAGLIHSHRLGVAIYHGSERHIGTVFRLTKSGNKILKTLHPNAQIRDEEVPINSSTLIHDLILSDVLVALKIRFPNAAVTNGKLIKREKEMGGRVPDAILFDPDSKIKVAIELELTAKSEKRYREIILGYRLDQTYSHVLYVVGISSIHEKMEALIDRKRVEGLPSPVTGKFYFVGLDLLLKDPKSASITNGESSFNTANQNTSNTFTERT